MNTKLLWRETKLRLRAELTKYERTKLSNGILVVSPTPKLVRLNPVNTIMDKLHPLTDFMIRIKAGWAQDELKGTAHLSEHLVCSERLYNKLQKLDIESNGCTSFSGTFYPDEDPIKIKRKNLKPALESYFESFENIDYERFGLERDRVILEDMGRKSSVYWGPERLSDEKFGVNRSDTDRDIKNISEEDIRLFIKKYYTPSNIVILMNRTKEAIKFLERIPVSHARPTGTTSASSVLQRRVGREEVIKESPDLYVADTLYFFNAPTVTDIENELLLTLGSKILEERLRKLILFGGAIKGYGARCKYVRDKGAGKLRVSLSDIFPADINIAKHTIEQEIDSIKKSISNEEFEMERERSITDLEKHFRYHLFNNALHDDNYMDRTIRAIFSATKGKVMEILSKTLNLDDCFVAVLKPGKKEN